jgi:hypothetical protein
MVGNNEKTEAKYKNLIVPEYKVTTFNHTQESCVGCYTVGRCHQVTRWLSVIVSITAFYIEAWPFAVANILLLYKIHFPRLVAIYSFSFAFVKCNFLSIQEC